jgi:MFS transporter, BCD family, chlorophyll transporter
VFLLGLANGVFAIGAIGSMMALTGDAKDGRAGLRLGVYGAAQAVAYAVGVSLGGAGVDVARALLGSPIRGYAAVFSVEAALFVVAACWPIAARPRPTPVTWCAHAARCSLPVW